MWKHCAIEVLCFCKKLVCTVFIFCTFLQSYDKKHVKEKNAFYFILVSFFCIEVLFLCLHYASKNEKRFQKIKNTFFLRNWCVIVLHMNTAAAYRFHINSYTGTSLCVCSSRYSFMQIHCAVKPSVMITVMMIIFFQHLIFHDYVQRVLTENPRYWEEEKKVIHHFISSHYTLFLQLPRVYFVGLLLYYNYIYIYFFNPTLWCHDGR